MAALVEPVSTLHLAFGRPFETMYLKVYFLIPYGAVNAPFGWWPAPLRCGNVYVNIQQ